MLLLPPLSRPLHIMTRPRSRLSERTPTAVRRSRYSRVLGVALGLTALSCTPLLGQDLWLRRAERVSQVEGQIRAALQTQGAGAVLQQLQMTQPATASAVPGHPMGAAETLQAHVFGAAGVVVEPAAQALLAPLNARVDAALQASTAITFHDIAPNPIQVLNASLVFTATLARMSGEQGLVTVQHVHYTMAGLCPLYPIC